MKYNLMKSARAGVLLSVCWFPPVPAAVAADAATASAEPALVSWVNPLMGTDSTRNFRMAICIPPSAYRSR